MAPKSLAELYVKELQDLYSAEKQILDALPKMIEAATNPELKQGFETHQRQTEGHVSRLEEIFKELDEDADGDKCKGMEGIIKEGSAFIKEKPEPAVLDAGLIAAAQHVEHYEMAGYGSVKSWARRLGHEYQARLLEETLNEEKKTDALLTQMAEQSVNQEAEVGMNRAAALGDRATEARDSGGRGTLADAPARSW
jgi:ferritin-like metal-binding protein YciE